MQAQGFSKRMVQSVIFVSIFSLGMATSVAQEKYQITGKSTYAVIDQHVSFLDDVVYFITESKTNATLTEEGKPVTTLEGTFSAIKGTGQYENIRGSGTFKGRYISGYIFTLEWEGEYWIDK